PSRISDLLDAAAAAQPDRVALDFFQIGERLTFSELKREVYRTALALAGLGVRKGAHVSLMLPNISQLPVAWLAVTGIGAVLVCVNNRYTSAELHYVLNNSDTEVLITDRAGADRFKEVGGPLPKMKHVVVVGEA